MKPLRGNHGRGVSTNLNTDEEIEVVLNEHEDIAAGELEAHQLMQQLGVQADDLIENAYVDLLEERYEDWKKDPASVGQTWSAFFEGFELGSLGDGAT